MSDASIHTDQILESDFAIALDCIESSEPDKRREGAARLEKVGGNRAFQVASVLIGDADPIVSSISRRICNKFQRAGLMWRTMQNPARAAEKRVLSSIWLILDEVVFICRRNLSELAMASFISALPKLIFISLVFAGPFLIPDFNEYCGQENIFSGLFAHQLFWRPLAWLSIGRAFMGGFPDRTTRQQARQTSIWGNYFFLGLSNAITAIPYCVVAIGIYSAINSGRGLEIYLVLAFAFWIIFWEGFLLCNPIIVLTNSIGGILQGISARVSRNVSLTRQNISFLAVLGFLYVMIFASSMATMTFLGISLQPGNLKVPSTLWLLAFWIAADCLIDPFVIGYRLLVTKLCLGSIEK